VGAIRELIARLSEIAGDSQPGSGAEPQVFLTGGAGAAVAKLLGAATRHMPNLTLAGIAQVARKPHA
jgi:pantothenate kinase type III